MARWQRRVRLVIAVTAVAFAIVVAFALKRREPAPVAPPVQRSDPGAVVEVTGGRVERFRLSREDVRVAYQRQITYANGASKLIDVTIAADQRAGGRSFTVTGREADVGQNESTIQLDGDVRIAASDGLTARTERASYSDADGLVRAPGPVEFSRGRMTGSGVGMTYDTVGDVLTILDRSIVHVAPDDGGLGAAEISSGATAFARPSKSVRFERDVTIQRDGQTTTADLVVAHLTPDERQIQLMELRGNSRIVRDAVAPGGLRELAGRDMDLKYGGEEQALEHAVLVGDAAILVAGTAAAAGRQIRADTLEISLAPDGTTPVGLTARASVVLSLPPEQGAPARTIESDSMEATGDPARGLTRAQFDGNVEYEERSAGAAPGPAVAREATAARLEVLLEPGMSGFEEARFFRRVHFVDGDMTGDAAEARYDLEQGTLELSGSEPKLARPRVVDGRLAVDATRIDVTLAGPHLKAAGMVKSVVRPVQNGGSEPEARLPSMFRQDAPVNVTADALEYNGTSHRATYTGSAQLWQEDTSLKAATIVLDDKSGDLTAGGGVTTVTVREPGDKSGKADRPRTIATAADFRYEEAVRRATYTGKAHMSGPEGDLTAARIELYLKAPSGNRGGDDLDRVEAYEDVTLRDQNRTATGMRLTYTTADQRYVVTGAPVRVVDECRRETIGGTLTIDKARETITIDGNEQTRTQTKGSAQCS